MAELRLQSLSPLLCYSGPGDTLQPWLKHLGSDAFLQRSHVEVMLYRSGSTLPSRRQWGPAVIVSGCNRRLDKP